MRSFALLATLLVLPTVALAGSPAAPETTDPAHDATPDMGWNDMTAAWLSYDEGALRLSWQVSSWSDPAPFSPCWNLDFAVNGVAYDAIAQWTGDGAALTYRPTGSADSFRAPVTLDAGAPATLSARLGRHAVPVAPGDEVGFRFVLACENVVSVGYDEVESGTTYVVTGVAPPDIRAPSTYEGSFLVGDPYATFVSDACAQAELEGIDSSCVALAASDLGNRYLLTADALLVSSVCFYDAARVILTCGSSVIPDEAAWFSIAGTGGVDVAWRLDTFP